jgi:hypothetical protein
VLDNEDGTYLVTVRLVPVGVYTFSVNINGEMVGGQAFAITVTPGKLSSRSTAVWNKAPLTYPAGDTTGSILLTSVDAFGNLVTNPAAEDSGLVSLSWRGIASYVRNVDFTVTHENPVAPNGRFVITFRAPTASALYEVNIVVDNAATTQSPFAVTVTPGTPTEATTAILGKSVFEAGLVRFAVEVNDQFGSLVPGLAGQLAAQSDSNAMRDRISGVERSGITGAGIYEFDFIRSTLAEALIKEPGNFDVAIVYTAAGAAPVTIKTHSIVVTPGSPSALSTFGPLDTIIAIGASYSIRIEARDRFGSLITTTTDTTAFSLGFIASPGLMVGSVVGPELRVKD